MKKYEQAVALWQSYHIKTAVDLDLRLHNFRILFAYNSGKIENDAITYNDTREIFENGRVSGYSGDTRALFEQQNQKICYEYLKGKIAAKEPITLNLIRETHAVLTGGTYDERRFIELGERPGQFKQHDFVTGREEVGSLPEDVEQDMQHLLDELADYRDKDTLKTAAYFHARFEYIHPFADGNGRAGRTLLNYYLMTHDHPPVIIYEEDRSLYYDALHSYDKDEHLQPMYLFLQAQTAKTWEKALERERSRKAPPR